jgi:uncharacterized protein YdaU (DUF1376 family)
MNYYTHHLGDYAKDTRHLSLVDHGVYRLLLDHVYATEAPLPDDFGAVCRICGAVSRTEKESVRRILDAYFPLHGGARFNKRASLEIEAYAKKVNKCRSAIAIRWQNERNTDVSHSDNVRNTDGHTEGIPRARASIPQSPNTNLQSPEANPHPPAGGGAVAEFSHVPTDAEVIAFGAAFAGEPASGAPGPMPPDWLAEQLRGFHGRREFPIQWRRLLVAAWRADFRRYTQSGSGGEKNAAAPAWQTVQASKQQDALKRELREIEEQAESIDQCGAEVPGAMRRRLRELTGLLAGGKAVAA